LFATGSTICFGSSASGALGADNVVNISGNGGAVLATQGLILFSDAGGSATVEVLTGSSHTCIVRCNARVLCFGSGANGEIGRGSTASYGASLGDMAALGPIPFTVPIVLPSLTSLVLTNGYSVPNVATQTFHNLVVSNLSTIGVATFAAQSTCTAPVVTALNGEPVTKPVNLRLIVTNFLYIVVSADGLTTTYTISMRRMADAQVQSGYGNSCILVSNRVACWGVRCPLRNHI
jgi:hypothetical protein